MSARYLAGAEAVTREMCALIDAARAQIVLQMYLFARNGELEVLLPRAGAPAHAAVVAERLLAKRRDAPEVEIAVVLDTNTPSEPGRTRAGRVPLRGELAAAGIPVLHANLFENQFARARSLLPSRNLHLDWRAVPAAAWRARHNQWQVQKNVEDHRKNLVIDGGRAGLVTSHNLIDVAHDWYENGIALEGAPARALWAAAVRAVADALPLPHGLSEDVARRLAALARVPAAPLDVRGPSATELVSSTAIRPALMELIDGAQAGDQLAAASAYFSDVALFDALSAAAARGAEVRVLIDSVEALPLPAPLSAIVPGLVNHAVIARARARPTPSLALRVHHSTHGRMMHLKSCARFGARPALIAGQANFTPNSFTGAWLETDVRSEDPAVLAAYRDHFEALWALPESRPLSPAGLATALDDGARRAALWAFRQIGLEP